MAILIFKMKKSIFLLPVFLFAAFFFMSGSSAFCIGDDSSVESPAAAAARERTTVRTEMEAGESTAGMQIRERVETQAGTPALTGEQVKEQRKQNITAYFNNMAGKLEAAIGRLKSLADRIETRLQKARTGGKDTSSLEIKLAEARAQILKAETDLGKAISDFPAILDAKNPKQSFISVKNLIKGVWISIKTVHASLVEIITGIKGMSEGTETDGNIKTTDKVPKKITTTPGAVTTAPGLTVTLTPTGE